VAYAVANGLGALMQLATRLHSPFLPVANANNRTRTTPAATRVQFPS